MEGHNIDKAFAVMIAGNLPHYVEIVKRQKISENKTKSPTKKEVLQVTKITTDEERKKNCCKG